MKRLTKIQCATKWADVLEAIGLKDSNRFNDIAEWVEMIHVMENGMDSPGYDLSNTSTLLPQDSLLVQNLIIVSKIKDLSKVSFILSDKVETKTHTVKINWSWGEFHEMAATIGSMAVQNSIESAMQEQIILQINNNIENGHPIGIFMPIKSVAVIAEKTMAPQIVVRSAINYT